MTKLLFCQLLILLSLRASGQTDVCKPTLHYMAASRQSSAAERFLLSKHAIVRASIAFSETEKLLVYETGKDEPKAEFKIVSGEKQLLLVALSKMPGLARDPIFAGGLRPTWFARLCQASGKSMIVVASGSGATGEGQVFLVFLEAHGRYRHFQLPIAIKGRVELSAIEPQTFKLWTIVDSEAIGVALPHYEISTYKLDESGFHRLHTNRTKRGYDPEQFVNHPIVLENGSDKTQ